MQASDEFAEEENSVSESPCYESTVETEMFKLH